MKSTIAQGQMILHFNPTTMDKAKVWVKAGNYKTDDTELSLFIDNNAMVRYAIDNRNQPRVNEKWYISDRFYGMMVREGRFVAVDDLNQASAVCEELGWPQYEIVLGF
jgi:hypothetical protein